MLSGSWCTVMDKVNEHTTFTSTAIRIFPESWVLCLLTTRCKLFTGEELSDMLTLTTKILSKSEDVTEKIQHSGNNWRMLTDFYPWPYIEAITKKVQLAMGPTHQLFSTVPGQPSPLSGHGMDGRACEGSIKCLCVICKCCTAGVTLRSMPRPLSGKTKVNSKMVGDVCTCS